MAGRTSATLAAEVPAASDSTTSATQVEPPKVYFSACGAACDIFWWARRDSPQQAQPDASAPVKKP
jgi:hypothetical protein